MYVRKKGGDVSTNARLNFSQSEASLLLLRGGGGGLNFEHLLCLGVGGGINKHIPKNLSIAQKNVEMNFETIASTWKWRYLLLFATYF